MVHQYGENGARNIFKLAMAKIVYACVSSRTARRTTAQQGELVLNNWRENPNDVNNVYKHLQKNPIGNFYDLLVEIIIMFI